jgi:hypothetical protein
MKLRWLAMVPVFASIFSFVPTAANDANSNINRAPDDAVTILVKSSVNGSCRRLGGCEVDVSSLAAPNLHCATVLEIEATEAADREPPPGNPPIKLTRTEHVPISFNSISAEVSCVDNSKVNGSSVRIVILPHF